MTSFAFKSHFCLSSFMLNNLVKVVFANKMLESSCLLK